MYANSYGLASPPPGLSNNPFVEDPTTAHSRFPDINASSFHQPGYPSNGYPNQSQQYQQPQYQSYPYGATSPQFQVQPQLMPPQNQFASTSYAPQFPPQGQAIVPQPTSIGAFQSTSGGFAAQQYPMSTGYPYSSSNGYPGMPQQLVQTPSTTAPSSYLSEFDPYAQQPQHTQTPQAQVQTPLAQAPTGTGMGGLGPNGVTHPRDLIRVHKSGLEAWDTYSWKQLLGACDALKQAWSARKVKAEGVVRQYGGQADPGLFSGPDPAFGSYNSQVEGWKQVLRDANSNIDNIAASSIQLQEVFNTYRQSGDQASKRRVRESCNAAIKGLPDWPDN